MTTVRTIEDFKDLTVDKGTKILSRKLAQVGGYTAMHEYWMWDGIKAESLIFCSDDVSQLSDDDLKSICVAGNFILDKDNPYDFTVSRSTTSNFTFASFNNRIQ